METNFSENLSSWLKKLQRYKVTYKNGSYHLVNFFQSPETMIASFDQMPFCKHNKAKKNICSNNIFLASNMYYCNPEEGLWLIVSELHFKKNVMMRNLYDEKLPLDYHFINIHLKSNKIVNKSLINGMVLKDKTWSLFKAGFSKTEYHFKNSEEKNITLFFTDKWLGNQKLVNPIFKNNKLANFFNSSHTYMILDETDVIYEDFWETIMNKAEQSTSLDLEKIREIYDTLFHKFIEKLEEEVESLNHFNLSDTDRQNIQRAVQYLNNNLLGVFPGIEKTALKVGISPTKLKNDFKSIYKKTIYQYFSSRQMKVAHELILQKKFAIKEVAILFGYANASKFSAKFNKELNVLPSKA